MKEGEEEGGRGKRENMYLKYLIRFKKIKILRAKRLFQVILTCLYKENFIKGGSPQKQDLIRGYFTKLPLYKVVVHNCLFCFITTVIVCFVLLLYY